MKRTDLAYIAGIIDGEGFITIRCDRKANDKHSLYVGVGNTERWLLEWLRANFGGKLVTSHKPEGYKDFFQWAIVSRSAGNFLELVLPYLRLKKGQAELALQFQEKKYNEATGKRRGSRTSDEIIYEKACQVLMSALNKRGKHDKAGAYGNPVPSLSKDDHCRQEGVETRDENRPINKSQQIPPSQADEEIVHPPRKLEEQDA